MELTNLEALDLYIEEYDKLMNSYVRIPVSIEDMPIGELINIQDNDNKLKKFEDGSIKLIRVDTVDSVRKFTDEYDEEKSYDDIKNNILSKLDYEVEYADDRVELVQNLFKDNEWLNDLVSSKKYIKSNIKTKKSFLSEDTAYGKLVSVIASYILFPKFNNESDERRWKKEKDNDKNYHWKKGLLTKRKKIRNKIKEDLSDSNEIKNNDELNEATWVPPKQEITEEDLNDFVEIREMKKEIDRLADLLGYKKGLKKSQIDEIHKIIKEEYGGFYLNVLKNTYKSLNTEILDMKEKLRCMIKFKRLGREYSVYEFESDTGYVDENGIYQLVSEGKIEFNKKEHIKGLIKFYHELKEKYKEDFNHSMWAIIWSLDDLIRDTEFNDKEQFIWDLYKKDSKLNIQLTIEQCENEFKEVFNKKFIYNVTNNSIPSKVHKTFLDQYDEWLYTYRKKGKFKKCISCREVKLINSDRYFGKRTDKKGDGFYNYCRECEKVRKRGNK